MRTSIFGSTGLTVSALGLGTVELGMPYGLGRPAPPDDDSCIRLLRHAVDRGVSFIDTAAAYGRSEELIGRAFGGRRERPVIATKVTMRDPDGAMWSGPALGEKVAASIERSLRLLQTESLDLVQLHHVEGLGSGMELMDAMSHHIRSGKVLNWGASTYGVDSALLALRHSSTIRSLQIAYSVLDRSLEETVIPRATDAQVGVVLRSVLLKGVLSKRYLTLPPALDPLKQAAKEVAHIARDSSTSLPSLAIRFALFESGAHVALAGTSSIQELDTGIDAAEAGPLPREVVHAVREVVVSDTKLLNPANWPAS